MLQNEELEAEKEDLLRRLNEAEQQVDDLQRQLQEARFSSDKIAYLTFDDGPCAITARILDILGQYDVKATFCHWNEDRSLASRCILVSSMKGTPSDARLCTRLPALYESEESFMNNMYRLQDLIREVTGHGHHWYVFRVAPQIRLPLAMAARIDQADHSRLHSEGLSTLTGTSTPGRH